MRGHAGDLPCILLGQPVECSPKNKMECGHFIEREREATRFHPWNVNKECAPHNSSHVSGYRPDKGFPYGLAIDEKWGDGVALFLYRLAHPLHEKDAIPKDESWTANELRQIASAARLGYPAFLQLYTELRPHHFPMRKSALINS
jgi:hypothetical protein